METFFIVVGIVIGLPVLSYMVIKFGRTGYLRANKEQKQKEEQ
jgi:hypothetical protein